MTMTLIYGLSFSQGRKPDSATVKFAERMSGKKSVNELHTQEIYVQNDSVFIVHYFYASDSTHPVRVGGGYLGSKELYQKYFTSGSDKHKFSF